jgi:branched-chain amino acid transport system ATP-binding protein
MMQHQPAAVSAAEPILEVQQVSRRFGTFQALTDISVSFLPGQLTAIIGPNGAGKSTFFNVVSGALAPSTGRIRFQGRDITGMAPHQYARIGIAKSFQITNVFRQLSAHENVRVAVQMRTSRFAILRSRAHMTAQIEQADALLARVGLTASRDKAAGDLAHGQQRALEVAMALVMMNLISTLAQQRTVILVEHKMKLVMNLCQRLIVLHHGELLADGSPEAIRANDDVRRVYLGKN